MHLKLLRLITFTGNRTIGFVYDASGAKLQKITNDNGTIVTQNYINGIEYIGNTLERIPHAEGEIVNRGGSYVYEYALKDHLGNTRVTFTNTSGTNTLYATDIKQINHYYPFGLNMEGPGFGAQGANKYQYNGIELNTEFGLNMNMAFFRGYDPAVGRWWQIDPKPNLSESSYSGMGNNPIKMTDPFGDTTWVYSSKNGKYLDRVDGGEKNQIHFMSANAYFRMGNKSELAVRKTSNYFIGKNTRAALAALNAPTKRDGQEQIFLMGYSTGNKELRIFNVTKDNTINSLGSSGLPGMSGGMDDKGIQNFIKKHSTYTFIGWGHSHPGDSDIIHSLSPSSPDFYEDGTISKTWDMDSQGMVNPFSSFTGGNPAIIPTPNGFSIYSTIVNELINDYNLQKMRSNPPVNILRDSYDFNGNTIFKQ